jgi:membrane fusion protein (multidrug efflux system)
VKVKAGLPERDVAAFAKDDSVKVRLDSLPGKEFDGRIYRVSPTAEPATLTFICEVEVDNPDGLLKPGMIARATFVRKSYPDSIVVPLFAILSMENQRLVMVESDGVAHARPIEVGVLQGNSVQVLNGLKAGDRLITVGQRDLQDGDPVKVIEVL